MTEIGNAEQAKRVNELIRMFGIEKITHEGERCIILRRRAGVTSEISDEIKSLKPEILAELDRREEVRREEERQTTLHTHRFLVVGWEGHECSIDDRNDLDKECELIANQFVVSDSSITAERVKDAYLKSISAREEAKKRDEENEIKRAKHILEVAESQPDLPTFAQYLIWRQEYNNLENEGGDGYIPNKVTVEDVEWAKRVLKEHVDVSEKYYATTTKHDRKVFWGIGRTVDECWEDTKRELLHDGAALCGDEADEIIESLVCVVVPKSVYEYIRENGGASDAMDVYERETEDWEAVWKMA